jgi:hypothetical protein
MTNFLAVFSKVTIVPLHLTKACREMEVHVLATLLPGNNHYEMKRSYSGKNLVLRPETKP